MILHESPCGAVFSTADDASAHQWHCDQCAGVLEAIERELDAMTRPDLLRDRVKDMSVDTFKASHCGESFAGAEGAKAFESHMATEHKRRKIARPNTAPLAWKAPPAPKNTRKLTEILSKMDADQGTRGPLMEWHTDERDVPVIDLRAGDVFMWAGRVYDVTAIEGDTLQLTIRKSRHYPEKSAALTFDQIMSKTEVVSIIKRAA